MNPDKMQFSPKALETRAQIAADASWAKEQWDALGGDKAAVDFKPEFKGQSYEQQVASKKAK
jgi:hypothetical protein